MCAGFALVFLLSVAAAFPCYHISRHLQPAALSLILCSPLGLTLPGSLLLHVKTVRCAACSKLVQAPECMVKGTAICIPWRQYIKGVEGDLLMVQSFKEVKEVMAEFKSKYSLSKVGAQGFCWGGKYTVLLLGERH